MKKDVENAMAAGILLVNLGAAVINKAIIEKLPLITEYLDAQSLSFSAEKERVFSYPN